MKRWHVYGKVVATKYLGKYEAETAEEAKEMALNEKGFVDLCHQCVAEAENADIEEAEAEEIEETKP
jgi:hypothetical protein